MADPEEAKRWAPLRLGRRAGAPAKEIRRLQETLEDKLRTAIQTTINPIEASQAVAVTAEEETAQPSEQPRILTTPVELQAFYIVKAILGAEVELDRITAKDTASYFNVLLDNNVRKWICRLHLEGKRKSVTIQGETQDQTLSLNRVEDLYQYREELLGVARRILGVKG